jgi:tripartite-type tricarboxylate transporter receptor subunit TctC
MRSFSVPRIVMLAAVCAWLPLNAAAQTGTWPDKPVKLIVPFPPGGAVDLVGRLVAERVTPLLGQSVVIENRAGAGGSIGAEAAAKAAPDGYTLFEGTGSTHGTNPSVYKKLTYDPIKDFTPVTLMVSTPYTLVARVNFPAKTTADLVAWAKANPGKLNFATYGAGSSNHLPMELLKAMTGIEVAHIPYKGAAPAVTALMAGEVDVIFDVISTSGPHIKAGKLKFLGIANPKRTSLAPEVPTLNESGVPGFEAGTYFGIFGPAGMPRPIVDRLNREFVRALRQPEMVTRLGDMGYEVIGSTPEELGSFVAREVNRWITLVRERNIKFD